MRQNGNALFLILIAVALFAALSYAVTQSGRGGGSVDREQAAIAASQVVQYSGLVEQTVQKLTLLGGCAVDEIGWASPSFNITYSNPRAPAGNVCEIFESAGGGLSVESPPAAASSTINGITGASGPDTIGFYFIDGRNYIDGIGTATGGAVGNDIVIRLQTTEPVCREINQRIRGTSEIPTSITSIIDDGAPIGDIYDAGGAQTITLACSTGSCAAQATACYQLTGGPAPNQTYQFYHVLVAR